jgi:hypothetical protein
MFYKNREIYPEKGLYGNGNLAITLHECQLIEDEEGFKLSELYFNIIT